MSCSMLYPLVLAAAIMLTLMLSSAASSSSLLKVGFYSYICPEAEKIIANVVKEAVVADAGIAADLLRMHFHDCFVRGCDASVLLDPLPGVPAEKESVVNNHLQGFEVINEAKAKLESVCPSTVSCADIIAFAARDSVQISSSGQINYSVPAGRRDGRTSVKDDVIKNLPSPKFNADQLISNFANKGLTLDEMVTLSGAHSIGVAHCSSLSTDPLSVGPAFSGQLKGQCPRGDNASDPTVDLDVQTPGKLDNKYYLNLVKKRGVLGSDQTLWTSRSTAGLVARNAEDAEGWAAKFATAMVRMGAIEVLTGEEGEVRERCWVRK